jgi:hypothetical protein
MNISKYVNRIGRHCVNQLMVSRTPRTTGKSATLKAPASQNRPYNVLEPLRTYCILVYIFLGRGGLWVGYGWGSYGWEGLVALGV